MTFSETDFVDAVARRQARRLGALDAPWREADAHVRVGVRDLWPCERAAMTTEAWIIARMAADTRRMIVAAAADDSATVEHDDLIALGWTQEQVRRFGAVALAAALASVKAEADLAHQRQFSGFAASATSAVLAACCFTIGLACVGVASLL
jgi:hypothetical protein